MNKLNGFTNNANQNYVYNVDGKRIALRLYFSSVSAGWFADISCNGFDVKNIRLGCNENILNKWRRLLNFGLKITAIDNIDPVEKTAFSSGRVSMYILNEEELSYVTNIKMRYNSELVV